MIDVVVCGALGRMGGTVARVIHDSGDCRFVGGVDLKPGRLFDAEVVVPSQIDEFLTRMHPDVLVDFTAPAASVSNVQAGARHGISLVVGTTGFTDQQREEIRKAVEGKVPAVISSNFSIGMNIFWQLVREAARLLPEYDIELIEAHHRNKKDAPSGTAKTILSIIEEEAGPREKRYGREGMTERGKEIGVHVIRGGDIVGDHTILFSANYETIELSHRAIDRSVFAQGALRATRWVAGKPAGIYGMPEVLGLGKRK